MSQLILVSGGIGSGKSTVCRILKAKGFPVYDCDLRAKSLMSGHNLTMRIAQALQPLTSSPILTPSKQLDPGSISTLVFSNPQALETLNSIVHPAVRADLDFWNRNLAGIKFVECAIPHTAQIRSMVDAEWVVTSPDEIRIDRVCRRNALTPDQVRCRISAQENEWSLLHQRATVIDNSPTQSLLLQICSALKDIQIVES